MHLMFRLIMPSFACNITCLQAFFVLHFYKAGNIMQLFNVYTEGKMDRILLVEDDLSLIDGLEYALEKSGFKADIGDRSEHLYRHLRA